MSVADTHLLLETISKNSRKRPASDYRAQIIDALWRGRLQRNIRGITAIEVNQLTD